MTVVADEFAGTDGLVDPAVWPYRAESLGLEWVEGVRATAVQVGRRAREAADQVEAAWRGLRDPGVYESTEASVLYAAMDPVVEEARREADLSDEAANALEHYAGEVGALELRLRDAESQAAEFRAAVSGGITVPVEDLLLVRVSGLGASPSFGAGFGSGSGLGSGYDSGGVEVLSWWEHRPSVDRNQDLLALAAGLTEQVRGAEERLVRSLQGDDAGRGVGWGVCAPGRVGSGLFSSEWSGSSGPVVPEAEWFATASDEELLAWWRGLEAWEREAAGNAIEVMDLDSAGVGQRIAQALEEVVGRPEGTEDVEVLDVLVELFGADQEVMGQAFTTVGAAGLIAALNGTAGTSNHLDETPEQRRSRLRVIRGLRDSLAQVSAGWDRSADGRDAAREFVRERELEDLGWFLRPELGYLFADQYDNPMGRELTIAVADHLDQLERGDLEMPAVYYEPPASPLRDLLWEHAGEDEGSMRINDPTARVLGTLGQYPEAALDWLTDTSPDAYSDPVAGATTPTGEARLGYYYGVRDSASSGDGFEGVAALWHGALQADGGPFDPAAYDTQADAYDPQTWHDVAMVTTLAARGLGENPAFMPESVSVPGSVELAHATELTLPHLIDTTVIEPDVERAKGDDAEPTAPGRRLPGLPGVYELPNVTQAAFGELIAGATATEESTTVLTQGARAHQEALTILAREGVNPDRMIERNAFMQGVIDGAEHGGDAGTAERKDEKTDRAIETVSSTVKAVVPGAAGKVVDLVAGPAVDAIRRNW